MARSSAPSAPTIICVLCPAGAKRGAPRSFAAAMRAATRPMEARMEASDFSGASWRSDSSRGSSTLIESRSAWRPASASSSGDASGMILRWM